MKTTFTRQISKLREDEKEFVHCYPHLKKENKFFVMLEAKQSCHEQPFSQKT